MENRFNTAHLIFIALVPLMILLPIPSNAIVYQDTGTIKGSILVYATGTTSVYTKDKFDDDLPAILTQYGYSTTITDRNDIPEINGSVLAGYDELWILSTQLHSVGSFSPEELEAIFDFRDQGKGLLIMGDHTNYSTDANQVAKPLGVSFFGQTNHGPDGTPITPQFAPHPLFNDVNSICGHASEGNMTVSGSAEVVATYLGDNIIAALNDESGRVVFDVSFVRLLDDGTHGYAHLITVGDNPQYVRNIADWLKAAVSFDIHPRSCPNPFNITWLENSDKGRGNDHALHRKGGVLPAALVGSDDFDVTDVDLFTLRLEGLAPLRTGFEDVTRPVTGGDECACTTGGPDGILDLTLKFSRQEVAGVLGEVEHGDVVELTITGALKDGTPFEASDCITILSKHPEPKIAADSDEVKLYPAIPNPFNPSTTISYYLPVAGEVALEIYDSSGRLISRLLDRVNKPKGMHEIEWNGIDEHGKAVASGVYFYRLIAGEEKITKKIVLLR